ncbi:MAG: SRPBCC family protein [Sulfitobacter sp.]
MKFSTKEDIEAPLDAVFDMLCDFETFERSAIRRGAEVQRTDALTKPGTGMTWTAAFSMRGKMRFLDIELIRFERPNEMAFQINSAGLAGLMQLELIALSRSRTRIMVSLEMRPQNLPTRLLIQSLKLAKSSLTKRYKLRVAEYAMNLEDRYRNLS